MTFGPYRSTQTYQIQQPVADQRSSEAHPSPLLLPAASTGDQSHPKLKVKQKRSMKFLNVIRKRWKATRSPLPPRPPWAENPKGKNKGQGGDKSQRKSETKTQGRGKDKGRHRGQQES